MKIKKNDAQMGKHLNTQLVFLSNSCDTYDSGFEEEALRLATTIRVLLHDAKSDSLLTQLNIKSDLQLISSVSQYYPANMVTYTGLFGMRSNGYYIPLCNMDDKTINRWLLFDDWWNEIVLDDKKHQFSRKDIVLFVANKEGGAHIDNSIDESDHNMHYMNSSGWKFNLGPVESEFSNSAAYASIRQISHEVLLSIDAFLRIKSYTRRKIGQMRACYIDRKVYFVNEDLYNDSCSAILYKDERITKHEVRTHYIDNLSMTDMDNVERKHIAK